MSKFRVRIENYPPETIEADGVEIQGNFVVFYKDVQGIISIVGNPMSVVKEPEVKEMKINFKK